MRDRLLGRAMVLCVSLTSIGLLVCGSARVAQAAGVDSTRTATAVPKTEDDTLRGRSGKLRAVLVPRSERRVGILERLFGDSLLRTPGVHSVPDSSAAE